MTARYIIADVFDGLASLEDNSVDLIFSSPPFLALRSYLPSDHPQKDKEIGSEATPADFLDTLLDVVEACDRVLAPHGSLVFELGDTFAGSGGAGGDYGADGARAGQEAFTGSNYRAATGKSVRTVRDGFVDPDGRAKPRAVPTFPPGGFRQGGGRGWPLDKSLSGIPTLFAWSLAYGRNLLRPERVTPPWRIRNVVAWCRPNPPVGALGDKFRPGTSYLTVATKARDRWFDLDAVRMPYIQRDPQRLPKDQRENGTRHGGRTSLDEKAGGRQAVVWKSGYYDGPGAPPLDWWALPTEPYKGSHYATFPRKLVDIPVLSMCPRAVCRVCGEPRRRITETTRTDAKGNDLGERQFRGSNATQRTMRDREHLLEDGPTPSFRTYVETLGWSDCGHGDDWRPGVLLDPFAGSGTALQVAIAHGRDAVGIDLDSRNADLAVERCGLFLEVQVLDSPIAS